jgi:putative transposase
MMLDDDIVAVSPATVYRVLRTAGRLDRNRPKPTFGPHVHWHVDLAVVTVAGTYYYLCSVLNSYSRYVVHWDFLDRMTEADIELILQRALEAHPGARPRLISDNGRVKRCSTSTKRLIRKRWLHYSDMTGGQIKSVVVPQ